VTREQLERRYAVVQKQMATANGEWYQELVAENAYLERELARTRKES
jgi:hypothetical protein